MSRRNANADSGAGGGGPCYPSSEQSPGGEVKLIRCWRIE